PGHIRLWNDTPLRNFEPHLLMAILILLLVAGIGYFIYFKRKAKLNKGTVNGQDDDEFLELTIKKNLLLKKIVKVEEAYEESELFYDEFNQKNTAYNNYLYKVKHELKKFIE